MIYPKENEANPIFIPGHRSLRTTKLLFKIPETAQRDDFELFRKTIRQQAKQIVTYINNHGGFTIVLWSKRGETIDLADSDEMTRNKTSITAEKVTHHIACLQPTAVDPHIETDRMRFTISDMAHDNLPQSIRFAIDR
jgi:hypothetical protein